MNPENPAEEAARLKRQGSEQAIQLALESKWEEAVTLNRTILNTHPTDVDTWNRLGKALLEVGRFREAFEAYGRSIELDPVNQIARRNLDRLEGLQEVEQPRRGEGGAKVSQDIFIEEVGKSGVTYLRGLSRDLIAGLNAGDEVYLKPNRNLITIENAAGDALGAVEPKMGLRLLRMIEGGNRYAAAVKSVNDADAEVIIKEIYRDPSQTRLSFPATTSEGVRPYIKESLLRLGEDDDDEVVDDDGENEDWEGEQEPSENSNFGNLQNVIEHDVDDEDED